MLELIARFIVVGGLACGGGQAALPLVERLAVADTGWLTPAPARHQRGLVLRASRPGSDPRGLHWLSRCLRAGGRCGDGGGFHRLTVAPTAPKMTTSQGGTRHMTS